MTAKEKLRNEYDYFMAKKGIRKDDYPETYENGFEGYIIDCVITEREKNRQLSALIKESK